MDDSSGGRLEPEKPAPCLHQRPDVLDPRKGEMVRAWQAPRQMKTGILVGVRSTDTGGAWVQDVGAQH